MEGRVVVIRVSDADFATLDQLKRTNKVSWNQLLLEPLEALHGITLESAHPKEKAPEPEKPPKARGKAKPKGKVDPASEPTAEEAATEPGCELPPPEEDVPAE